MRVAQTLRAVTALSILAGAFGGWAAAASAQDAACRKLPTSACVFEAADRHAGAIAPKGTRTSAFQALAKTNARLGRVSEALEAANTVSDATADDLREIASALAEGGHFDQALQIARSISSPEQHAWALVAVARAAVGAGQGDTAGRLLDEARQVAGQSATTSQLVAASTADLLARAGRFDQALEVAGGIADPATRSAALERLVGVLAEAGRLDQSEQVAGQITDLASRSTALAVTAKGLAGAGQAARADRLFDEAWRIAGSVSDSAERPRGRAQGDVVVLMAKAGRFEAAEERAGAIGNRFSRGLALAGIGVQRALAGHDAQAGRLFQQAAEVVAGLGAPYLGAVVDTLARGGQIDEAERLAATINDSYVRADVTGKLAIAAAAKGRFEQAMRLINGIPAGEGYARILAIPELVVLLARAGVSSRQMELVSQAVDLAGMAPVRNMEAFRVMALAAIAEALAKAGL